MFRHFPGCNSAFLPPQIANISLWLKADSLSLNDGDNVTTWTDSSANANNAVGSYRSSVPAVYKTNIINGKPVVRFNNDSAYLLSDINPTAVSVFMVFRRTSSTTSKCFLTNTDGSLGTQGWALGISDSVADRVKWYTASGSNEGSSLTLNQAAVLCGTISAGTGTLFQDGTQIATGAAQNPITYGTPTVLGAIYMGGGGLSQQTIGDIAEVVVYGRLVTATERGQVTTYLKDKYAIT